MKNKKYLFVIAFVFLFLTVSCWKTQKVELINPSSDQTKNDFITQETNTVDETIEDKQVDNLELTNSWETTFEIQDSLYKPDLNNCRTVFDVKPFDTKFSDININDPTFTLDNPEKPVSKEDNERKISDKESKKIINEKFDNKEISASDKRIFFREIMESNNLVLSQYANSYFKEFIYEYDDELETKEKVLEEYWINEEDVDTFRLAIKDYDLYKEFVENCTKVRFDDWEM